MDDIIFERDYRRTQEDVDRTSTAIKIFSQAFNGSFIKDYIAAMDAIPKVIVAEDQKNYEYLLSGWKAKGVVDYHRWYSYIELTMPRAEFDDADSLALLREAAERAATVTFEAQKDGVVKLHIMIDYFQELISEEYRSYLEYEAISKDEKLAEMVGIQPLPLEMEQQEQKMMAPFGSYAK